MQQGFTKLHSSILTSSVWSESYPVRLVWVTMMAMADQDGEVHASILGLARQANVTLSECESAIKVFLSPDPYSRTKDHEGRRIEETDGGWLLLNFDKYREKFDQEKRREYLRRKKSESRAKNDELLTIVDSQQTSTAVNNVNTKEEEEDKEEEKKKTKKKAPVGADSIPNPPEPYQTPKCLEAWEAFKAYRAERKPKVTPRSAQMIFKAAADFQVSPEKFIARLEDSIRNSWQGVFFDNDLPTGGRNSQKPSMPAEDWGF